MSDQKADPKILNRLSNMPPYLDEKGNAVEEKPQEEEKVEDLVEEREEVVEEVEENQEEVGEKEEQPEVTEEKALENSKNPERTKEYIDKLKAERDEARIRAKAEQNIPVVPKFDVPELPNFQESVTNIAPTPQQYPNLTDKQIKETMKTIVDENGYVDTGLMDETFNKLSEQARIATERAERAEKKIDELSNRIDSSSLEEKKIAVHEKYPSLNPDRTDVEFDGELWDSVKNEMVGQQLRGEKPDFMSAADKWYNRLHPEMNKKVKETQNAMKQINATGTKVSTSQREQKSEGGYITKKGQLGDRLKASGY